MARVQQRPHSEERVAYADWEWHCAQVETFVRERGHCHLGEHPAGEWLRQQQRLATAGHLSAERQSRLVALGVAFDAGDDAWSAMLQQLRRYLIRHRVPRKKGREKWVPDPPDGALAAWLREQRAQWKSGLLPPAQARLLARLKLLPSAGRSATPRDQRWEALGFTWATERSNLAELWEQRYAQMVAFKQEHGHTRVPKSFDKQLWCWRHVQREFRKAGMLKPERIARLDAIGFEWEEKGKPQAKSREERWELQWGIHYDKLVEFHRVHGHSLVPVVWKDDPDLGSWVAEQRKASRVGKLRPDRQARLDELGFVWKSGYQQWKAAWPEQFQARQQVAVNAQGYSTLWNRRYGEMVAFKEQHGHTRVPKKGDKKLWHWRHVQREFRRKGMLKPERIARLDAIGFEWEGRDPPPAP